MASLKSRLSASLTTGLLLFFTIQLIVVTFSSRYITEKYVYSRLEHDIESLLEAIEIKDGIAIINPVQVNPTFKRLYSGHYYLISVNDVSLYSRSLWSHPFRPLVPAVGKSEKQYLEGPEKQELMVLSQTFEKSDELLTVSVAEDLTQLNHELKEFQLFYTLFSFIILVILLFVQKKLTDITLEPVQLVRKDIDNLMHGQVSRLREEVPAELFPLIKEFNNLISAMEKRLLQSRNAVSNLAHSLKLPLTLANQELDLISDDTAAIKNQLKKINSVIEHELKKARVSGGYLPGNTVNLKKELTELVGVMKKIYYKKNPDIQLKVPENAEFFMDREDFLELFGNLLDNACKWSEQKILITVNDKRGLYFSIEDDGPGCSQETISRLSERGFRVDESVPGHGVGLAVVKEIVQLYSGEIRFGNSKKLGGLEVLVSIP